MFHVRKGAIGRGRRLSQFEGHHQSKRGSASAILATERLTNTAAATLISKNPYHDFARALALFYTPPAPRPKKITLRPSSRRQRPSWPKSVPCGSRPSMEGVAHRGERRPSSTCCYLRRLPDRRPSDSAFACLHSRILLGGRRIHRSATAWWLAETDSGLQRRPKGHNSKLCRPEDRN